MFTLLVGVLIVAGSAVGFGLALFGRRPIPQPAMQLSSSHLGPTLAEAPPSSPLGGPYGAGSDADGEGRVTLVTAVPAWWRRILQRDESAQHVDASDVTLSTWVKVRSGLMLLLTVVGIAAIVGGALSILFVGLGLLVT